MSFKPIDAKRDEYRKYLEQEGVVEVLSKAIVKLFDCSEKPDNAIDFIRSHLGDAMLERDTIDQLKQELEDSRNEVAHLKRQLEALQLERTKGTASTVVFEEPEAAEHQEQNVEESASKNAKTAVEENPVSQNESEGAVPEDADEEEGEKDATIESESSENDQAAGASNVEEKSASNDPVPDEKQTSAEQKEGENAQ